MPIRFVPVGVRGIRLIEEEDRLLEQLQKDGCPWEDAAQPTLLELAARLREPAIEANAVALAPLVAPGLAHICHGETLLKLVLGSSIPRIPEDRCTLSAGRRTLALRFLEKPGKPDTLWFWSPMNGNASLVCRDFGVPHDRAVWLEWLGAKRRLFGLLPPD